MIHRWSLNDFLAKFTSRTKIIKIEFCRQTSAHCAFFTATSLILYSGFVSFFEQKIQGPFKDFQGHISHFSRTTFSAKKEPWIYVFFSSSTSGGLCVGSFSFSVQGLSRPWIFILKFKDFQGFKVLANPVYLKLKVTLRKKKRSSELKTEVSRPNKFSNPHPPIFLIYHTSIRTKIH